MNKLYSVFEHFSVACIVGVTVIDITGGTQFRSSVYNETAAFVKTLTDTLDCTEADHVAVLYGCYQARRFGGRYIFLAPSQLAYCVSPLTDETGNMKFGVAVGPFLMTDYEEYLEIDVYGRHLIEGGDEKKIRSGLQSIPIKTPAQVQALNEQLFVCTAYHTRIHAVESERNIQSVFPTAYSVEKEDELLTAISMGDVKTAGALLNDILGQILFHSDNNLEILRSRVVELTVLLSRAALRGGANVDAILGLNYSYLREIDALSCVEDMVLWLHSVTKRFSQHVFDYASAKHVDIIYKATAYIKRNYAEKISLQDLSDHVFLSVTYFSKVFKDETGLTPGAYITSVRIEESKRLLREMSVSIADIPELVGFEGQSYFTRVFKKAEGCTPGRFRQKHLERTEN